MWSSFFGNERTSGLHVGREDISAVIATITKILYKKLQVDEYGEMAMMLCWKMVKQIKKKQSVWKHPLGDYEVLNEETW